jgi:hypothetical protein
VKQIRLTERQIQRFIGAQKDMAVVVEFGLPVAEQTIHRSADCYEKKDYGDQDDL